MKFERVDYCNKYRWHETREPGGRPEAGLARLVVLILALAGVLGFAVAMGGCSGSQIGPSFETTEKGTFVSRNTGAGNTISLYRNGESWVSEATVPNSYVEIIDANGEPVSALGPKSRVMVMPLLGQEMKLASDTDITFSIDEATLPDGTVLKNLTISTLASPVIRAQNEALDRLAVVLQSRDAKSAEALLADAEAVKGIVSALGPGILDVLKTIAGAP